MLFHSPWFSLEPYAEIPLTELLAPSAQRFRDKPAFITAEGKTHTFGETWAASRRLGRYLQDAGIRKGDRIFYYHTGKEKAVVGVAEVVKAPYPDPAAEDDKLAVVDLKPVEALVRPVPLAEIKRDRRFADFELVKFSRLSVMPVGRDRFDALLALVSPKKHGFWRKKPADTPEYQAAISALKAKGDDPRVQAVLAQLEEA